MNAALLFLPLLVVASIGHSQTTPDAGSYLGQNPPGATPVIFAAGVISNGNIHSRLEISPDGQEMFWNTVDMKTFSAQILSVKNVSGRWSAPPRPVGPGVGYARCGDGGLEARSMVSTREDALATRVGRGSILGSVRSD